MPCSFFIRGSADSTLLLLFCLRLIEMADFLMAYSFGGNGFFYLNQRNSLWTVGPIPRDCGASKLEKERKKALA